ncbi:acyltransferase [Caballeronia sp. NK8]|nr:acyltransferase [Caballeronia sp. NK8]
MAYLQSIGETTKFSDFMLKRITRVVPLYWITTIAWAYVINSPGSFELSRVLESLFFIPREDNTAVNGPGWTLNFEMFFYVLFGVVTLVFRVSTIWIGIVFVVMAALGEATGFYVFTLYTDPIVWCFVAGIVIFHIHRFPFVRREATAIFWLGVLLLFSAIFYHQADSSRGVRQFLPWGVPSMLIVLGAVGMEAAGKGMRLFGSRIVLQLGAASYALYLTHSLCFVGISLVLLYKIKVQNYVGPDGAILVYLLVCVAVGMLTHWLVEKPVTKLMRKLMPRKPARLPTNTEPAGR